MGLNPKILPPSHTVTKVTDADTASGLVRACGETHPILQQIRPLVYWGSELLVLSERGKAVSYNVTYYGRKKIGVWQPYANAYVAYTVVEHRRRGYASILYSLAREQAIERGCRRLKSLACTREGLYFHIAMGDVMWGVDDKDQVVIDSPLIPVEEWPPPYLSMAPPSAKRAAPEALIPLTIEQILSRLGDTKLRYDK